MPQTPGPGPPGPDKKKKARPGVQLRKTMATALAARIILDAGLRSGTMKHPHRVGPRPPDLHRESASPARPAFGPLWHLLAGSMADDRLENHAPIICRDGETATVGPMQ